MSEYAKSTAEVMESCEQALREVMACRAVDGTKCAPNDSDFVLVQRALADIYEYRELRGLNTKTKLYGPGV